MVKNGVRFCDICKEEIPKGARYRVNTILKNGLPPDPSEKETGFDAHMTTPE
jgi:hypothetical protein